MSERIPARWYFDVVSPYAYLYFKRLGELHPALAVEPDELRRLDRLGDVVLGDQEVRRLEVRHGLVVP